MKNNFKVTKKDIHKLWSQAFGHTYALIIENRDSLKLSNELVQLCS